MVRRPGARWLRVPSPAGHGLVLRVGSQASQDGLPKIPRGIRRPGGVQPLRKVRHHRLRLQPFLAEKTLTRPHHRVRTLSRLEGSSVESVRQSDEMAGVARAWSSCRHTFHVVRPSNGPHPARPQRRRTPPGQPPRGLVRTTPPPAPCTSSTGARDVSPRSTTKSPNSIPTAPCKKCTMPPSRNMTPCGDLGTSSASSGSATGSEPWPPTPRSNLLVFPRMGGPLATARRLFRRTHQHRPIESPGRRRPRGKDQVPGGDVTVPVGQQTHDVPRGASRDPDQLWPHRHRAVLWTVPSRVAPSPLGQTHLFPLCQVRGDRDGQTSPRARPSLHPHPRQPPIARDMVHARTPQGRGKGVHLLTIHEVWHSPHPQRRTGLFAEDENTWLKIKQESADYPGWAQTPAQKWEYIQAYREREGIGLDLQRLVKNSGRKATAKLMLNSFWGKFYENLCKPTRHHPRTSLPSRLQSHLPHSHGADLQPGDPGSGPLRAPRQQGRQRTGQPLHHRLHHLSRPPEVVRVSRPVKRTGPLLRHRLGHLLPPSRPTRHPDGGFLGGDDGRVARRRLHGGFLLWWP